MDSIGSNNSGVDLRTLQGQALVLMQALLGVISPNFRMVHLVKNALVFEVLIILEEESSRDRDEIDDLRSEYEALQERGIDYEFEVRVASEPTPWPSDGIVVYRRRESN